MITNRGGFIITHIIILKFESHFIVNRNVNLTSG